MTTWVSLKWSITKRDCSSFEKCINFVSNGYGISIINDKITLQGIHINGELKGYGEVFNNDGSKFFLFFNNNLRNGFSLTLFKDGRISFGNYYNDIRNGPFIVSNKGILRLEIWNHGF